MAIDMAMENLPLRDSFPRGLDLHLVLASSHIWLLESCCNTTTTKPVFFFPGYFILVGKDPPMFGGMNISDCQLSWFTGGCWHIPT